MKKSETHGIWSGGEGEYLDALQAEEKKQIEALREKLMSETDSGAKKEIKDRIKAIQTDFKKKRKAAKTSLFMGA